MSQGREALAAGRSGAGRPAAGGLASPVARPGAGRCSAVAALSMPRPNAWVSCLLPRWSCASRRTSAAIAAASRASPICAGCSPISQLKEKLWLLLIRALDGAGRHAEALGAYEQARTVIADQLGVDPGRRCSRRSSVCCPAGSRPLLRPRRKSDRRRVAGGGARETERAKAAAGRRRSGRGARHQPRRGPVASTDDSSGGISFRGGPPTAGAKDAAGGGTARGAAGPPEVPAGRPRPASSPSARSTRASAL